ncbi:WG repeat-containing protein [Conchiformibius steedae]|uniref:WG repeat-containing protein n=1 Tax=Conchiformibius steedae TaxID=153493 RepID=UPI0026F010BD|nr:WG repeat-containing protein [Conchiformibius steedae]
MAAAKCEKPQVSGYESVGCLKEGLASVQQNGKWGVINKSGKVVIPFQYDEYLTFSEGLAGAGKNGRWGFINKSAKVVIPFQYDNALEFKEGLTLVKQNGRWGVINKSGKVVAPIQYDGITRGYPGGWIAVKKNGKWGFINKSGKVVIPIQYDGFFDFKDGDERIEVEQNGNRFYIDKQGRYIANGYADACRHVYVGKVFFARLGMFMSKYEVLGLSSDTGKVTVREVDNSFDPRHEINCYQVPK